MVLSGWVWWAKSNGKGQLEYMYETFPEKYYMKTLNDCLKSDSALIRRLERAESEQEIKLCNGWNANVKKYPNRNTLKTSQ